MTAATHGESRNRQTSVELATWFEMRRRCYDPRKKRYERYGGRGMDQSKTLPLSESIAAQVETRVRDTHGVPIAAAIRAAMAAVALSALAACVTIKVAAPLACLPAANYTSIQEQALAHALQALDAANPLVQAMADYGAMRAANRACIASNPPKH